MSGTELSQIPRQNADASFIVSGRFGKNRLEITLDQLLKGAGLGIDPIEIPDLTWSTGNATYYVDNTLGNDSNPGTDALPFKTIAKVLSLIPTVIRWGHIYNIYFKTATWNEALALNGKCVLGVLRFMGNDFTPGNHQIAGIDMQNVFGRVLFQYLKSTRTGLHAILINSSVGEIWVQFCEVTNADASYCALRTAEGADIMVYGGTYSNRLVGLLADYYSRIVTYDVVSGSGNTYGVRAAHGGILQCALSSVPTGTTPYSAEDGAILVKASGVVLGS